MTGGHGAPDDATLMTLAGIAYGAASDIKRYLETAQPTAGIWELDWLPDCGKSPANFAYAARNVETGDRVIAIRGTYPNPLSSAYWEDGHQDSPFGDMVAWPGTSAAKISQGTNTGFQNLLTLQNADKTDLKTYVGGLPSEARIWVTGHSLGGTLTPVLALWLTETFGERSSLVMATSFAGLTPGNAEFAALFGEGTALEGKIRRVYNTLDTVPYGWDRVYATHDFYQPEPEGGPVVSALLMATEARLRMGGYGFTAIGDPVPLKGDVSPPSVSCNLVAYVIENLHQHLPDTYLGLLNAPPLPFSILFGTIVMPRDAGPEVTDTIADQNGFQVHFR